MKARGGRFCHQRLGSRVHRFANSSSKNSSSIGERSNRRLACSISSGVQGPSFASQATARRNASPSGRIGGTVIPRLGGYWSLGDNDTGDKRVLANGKLSFIKANEEDRWPIKFEMAVLQCRTLERTAT